MSAVVVNGKLNAAILKIQTVLRGVKKDSANPHYKSRYADLDSVIEATRELLTDAELVIVQNGVERGGTAWLETKLIHVPSGETESSLFPLPGDTPQQMGSALTYMRRYAQLAILNLSQCDDDGEVASGRGEMVTRTPAPPVAPKPPMASPLKAAPGGSFGKTPSPIVAAPVDNDPLASWGGSRK